MNRISKFQLGLLIVGISSTLISAVFLATHPFPAKAGGLFLDFGEAILENRYRSPSVIDGYTSQGVPFAYPPLGMYLIAMLLDLGFDGLAIARFIPPVLLIAVGCGLYWAGWVFFEDSTTSAFLDVG